MKKLFTNTTNSPVYVGGTMVPPGEMLMVDVPGEQADATAAPEPTLAEQVALLLKDPVAKIIPSLGELNSDALDMMTALEGGASKPRSSLMAALGDEKIKRADAALTSDPL